MSRPAEGQQRGLRNHAIAGGQPPGAWARASRAEAVR